MKTIWVLENIRKDFDFYQRFNLLNLIASTALWRKWHPNDTTELYCDLGTYQLLNYFQVLDLWDKVDYSILSKESKIDKNCMWAASKLEVLATIQEPVTIADNDWLAFGNFDNIRNLSDVVYSHDENGDDYYLADHEWYLTDLKHTPIKETLFPTTQQAANVSFLTFNNTDILSKYANMSVDLMTEWTEMGIKDNRLIIYAEQKLLKQMLMKNNISHSPLIKDIWNCKENKWSTDFNESGIWNSTEIWSKFKHYGPDKRKYKDNEPGFEYEREVRFLYNAIGSSKRVDVELLKNKIKVIPNV